MTLGPCLLALSGIALAAAAAPLTAQQRPAAAAPVAAPLQPAVPQPLPEDTIDKLHPRYFVRVSEIKPDGDTVLILGRGGAPRRVILRPDVEIDRRSVLHIDFDRHWMAAQNDFESNLLITGQVTNAKGTQDIQIPGYHVLGEKAQSTPVRSRSSEEIYYLLMAFSRSGGAIVAVLDDLKRSEELVQREDAGLARKLAQFRSSESNLQALTRELARLRADTTLLAFPTREDSLSRLEQRVVLEERTYRLNDIAATDRRNVRRYLNRSTASVQNRSDELLALLTRLTSPDNHDVIRAVARRAGIDDALVVESARGATQRVRALASETELTDSATPESINNRLHNLTRIRLGLGTVMALAEQARDMGWAGVNLRLLSGLKEVDLSLPSVAAAPGDALVVTLHNYRDEAARSRSMDVRMRVREFGLVRNVTDSYMFFHRNGVGADYRAGVTADSARAAEVVRSTKAAAEYERALPMNFEPALGVTLGWTYYQRRNGQRLNRFVRWVEPGAGLNVSFPRFATRTATLALSNPADPTSLITQKVSDVRPQIGLSTGLVLTLFDGGVQLSTGYSLASTSKRRYHALGFSFFEVAKRLAQAAGS
jgi:hypothetical protein